MPQALVEILGKVPGDHRGGLHLPVDMHRFQVLATLQQPLVAQIAHHQCLGIRPEGHQRDDLAFVEIEGQRPLGGDRLTTRIAILVEDLDLQGGRQAGTG